MAVRHHFPDEYYWAGLDNAAKLIPAVSDTRGSNVFRLSAVLKAEIDADRLQTAVERALAIFPAFAVRLHRGLFWYYLESNHERPIVQKEHDYPCSPIWKGKEHGFLFRVTYYGKRINLEVFHALSDGMGSAQFLYLIVCYYFFLSGTGGLTEVDIRSYCDKVAADFDTDSFSASHTDTEQTDSRQPEPIAYHIDGCRYDDTRLTALTMLLPADKIVSLAHDKNATVSEYLTALIIHSIASTSCRRKPPFGKPVVVSLPVNLRRMFPSTTARNFFGHANIAVDTQLNGDFDAVLAAVKREFTDKLTVEQFRKQIAANVGIEKIPGIKFVPVWVKDMVMRYCFASAEKKYSITFSNLGKIQLPETIAGQVERWEMLLGGSRTHPKKVAACTHGNVLSLSFASTIDDNTPECFLCRYLTAKGIDVTLVSSETPPPEKLSRTERTEAKKQAKAEKKQNRMVQKNEKKQKKAAVKAKDGTGGGK